MKCSENLKGAARLTPLLTPKIITRVATWNIRTMYEVGKNIPVAREMKNYTIGVLGLSHHQAAKKGDLRDCSNHRGIMLLSTPGKVLNRVRLDRLMEAVDPKLRDLQADFRRNRSCADQIGSLCIIVEQSL